MCPPDIPNFTEMKLNVWKENLVQSKIMVMNLPFMRNIILYNMMISFVSARKMLNK